MERMRAEFGSYALSEPPFEEWCPMAKALQRQEEDRRRFEAEAQTMAKLHHPNIVAVQDVGGGLLIVSQFTLADVGLGFQQAHHTKVNVCLLLGASGCQFALMTMYLGTLPPFRSKAKP